MSVTGFISCPTRCNIGSSPRPLPSLNRLSPSSARGDSQRCVPRCLLRNYVVCKTRKNFNCKCAYDASYHGNVPSDQPDIFPRIHVRDPYKRLGISSEATEDEIQEARNFLVRQYAGHKPSIDSIESAHGKLIMQKYYEKKNPKLDLNKKARDIKQSPFLQAFSRRFQSPPIIIVLKTAATYSLLAALTVLYPTEEGPTFQVLVSFFANMYFIYDRLRAKFLSVFYGFFTFFLTWLVATFLMVTVIPPLPFIKGVRSFEVTTSLISYFFLWIASAYFK